ncbi:MAG: hypothetical protein KGH69_04620 [Candidatus Micrarchaeota archaeon]|nr:hypothetical protein [Candidatus Micrarchaeota archaeon]
MSMSGKTSAIMELKGPLGDVDKQLLGDICRSIRRGSVEMILGREEVSLLRGGSGRTRKVEIASPLELTSTRIAAIHEQMANAVHANSGTLFSPNFMLEGEYARKIVNPMRRSLARDMMAYPQQYSVVSGSVTIETMGTAGRIAVAPLVTFDAVGRVLHAAKERFKEFFAIGEMIGPFIS